MAPNANHGPKVALHTTLLNIAQKSEILDADIVLVVISDICTVERKDNFDHRDARRKKWVVGSNVIVNGV